MNTRERIDRLITQARKYSKGDSFWKGYIRGLEDLKLTVKPSERSIIDESS